MSRLIRGPGAPGAVALALLAAIAAALPAAARDGPTMRRAFTLEGEGFTIDLPPEAALSQDPGGAFVWIQVSPGAKGAPNIWLEAPYDKSQPFAFDQRLRWRDGLSLAYRLGRSVEQVDGGEETPEATLDGRLTLEGRAWTVACRLQGALVAPKDGAWCLPALGTLKAATP